MIYKALPIHQLLVGLPVEFDLYGQYSNGKKILFSSEGHIFTPEKRDKLIEAGSHYLYIKEDNYQKMKQYRSDNLVTLLKNPDLTSDERAQLLYESVNDQMYDMFEDGINETAIASSKMHIKAMVQM